MSSLIQKAYSWVGELLGVTYGNGGFQFEWGSRSTSSGIQVDGNSALKTIAVQRCVSLISSTLAMSPVYGYKMGKRREYVETSLDRVFNRAANPEWSGYKYRAYAFQQILLWGGHYAKKVRSGNRVTGLWPLPASQMARKWDASGELYYERNVGGKIERHSAEDIFYVPYLITDFQGTGLSVIEAHAEDIGMNQAARAHGASWFKNGARMSGLLKVPTKLSDEAYKRIRESWSEQYGGSENAHKPAILEQGMEFDPTSVKPSDSQLLETRIQNDEQVAMMFGTPPSMIGLTAKSTSWGTGIAEQVLGWQKFTVGTLGAMFCAEAQLQLLPRGEDIELRHDFSELLKADFKTMVAAAGDAHRGGLLKANECRDLLDYDPSPDGDKLLVQMQMVPIADAGKDLKTGGDNAPNPTV